MHHAGARRDAYVEPAWTRLSINNGNSLFVEEFCDFTNELAVIITLSRNGKAATYPVVETVQRNHVCHLVRAPAPVASEIATRAPRRRGRCRGR